MQVAVLSKGSINLIPTFHEFRHDGAQVAHLGVRFFLKRMQILDYIAANRLISFVAGTALLQLAVLGSGVYLRSTHGVVDTANPSISYVEPSTANQNLASVSNSSVSKSEPSVKNQQLVASAAEAPKADIVSSDTTASAPVKSPSVNESSTTIKYKVQTGDTLAKIWVENGGTYAGGIKAAKAFAEAGTSVGAVRIGETLEITKGSDGDIIRFSKRLGEGKTLILQGNSKDGYKGQLKQSKIVETKKVVSGEISKSFSASAASLSIPHDVSDELVDLFSARLEFSRDIQPGDSFSVIYTERATEDGEMLNPGAIEAASINSQGEMLAAIRHLARDGSERFFDEAGEPIGNYFLRYPVQFSRISSVFADARLHPVLNIKRPHNGVDFAAPVGTPVRSVAEGVVTYAGYNGGSGKMIKIRHTDKYSTAYLHLSAISAGITKGTRIKRGEIIGKVGQTGLATGPHLHYCLYVNDKYVDPLKAKLPAMPTNNEPIPVSYLQDMMAALHSAQLTIRMADAQVGGQTEKSRA